MYLEKNSEKKWLIKSESKILGPYTFDQVTDLIRKKQLSLIDEIRDPETRWLYVRENPEFKGIVEEMRKEIDARQESTKTYQSVSKTIDESLLVPEKEENKFTDISFDNKDYSNTQDIDIVKEILNNAAEYQPVRSEKTRVYGVKTDAAVQKKVSVFSGKVIGLTIVAVVLVLGGFFGYGFIQKRNLQKQEEELAINVRKLKYQGLYQKAAEAFARLPVAVQRRILPDLLEMYPLLSKMNLVTREDISYLQEQSLSHTQRASMELVNFLRAFDEKNYSLAQEALVKSTSSDATSLVTRENQALLYLVSGRFTEAYNQFKNLFNQEKSGRYLVGMTQSYHAMAPIDRAQFSAELVSLLEKYTTVYYDYKKELLLSQIVLAHEAANDVLFKVSVRQFLNTPCQLAAQFIKPPLVPQNSYLWKDLQVAREEAKKLLTGDELILFQLHDYLEVSQKSAATEFVANNVAKISNPQNRDQLNLLLFDSQERSKEAVTLEKSSNLDLNSELNHLLIGQNKLKVNADSDISQQIQLLDSRQQIFYRDWLKLDKLIRQNSQADIRAFLKDHFITIQNFNPVFEAKSLVN
ncbi:hypothetical protein [Pseudobdellovibrio exovorus]|uniref:Uncharacterized protein n=1 Tax=Pseudobdellovibrio exovorus JSS TaxID=1184267 RepID=M4V9W0_9BACT|nr:hypothetical protein [Pseudobdellovibrio exovorus]AGH96187.1 hypothetical protein A11Q_1971 [Pseudobdellovibrio exovorus JSS]